MNPVRAARIYLDITHGYGGPNVFVVDRFVNGLIKFFFEPVSFPQLYAAIGVGGTRHEVQLDVRLIDRMVGVFSIDESQSLDAAHNRQRSVAHRRVIQNRLNVFYPFLHQRHLFKSRHRYLDKETKFDCYVKTASYVPSYTLVHARYIFTSVYLSQFTDIPT